MNFTSKWRSVQGRLGPPFLTIFAFVLSIQFAVGLGGGEDELMAREVRAPFSSWAGKRSVAPRQASSGVSTEDLAQLIHDLKEIYMLERGKEVREFLDHFPAGEPMSAEKRAPFSSWAGKRSSFAGKRAPFSSWAGKRAPFSSWAGKRSLESDEDNSKVRVKRSSDEDEDELERPRRSASFSAWGGKRSGGEARRRIVRQTGQTASNHNRDKAELKPLRRPARSHGSVFSAWGGK